MKAAREYIRLGKALDEIYNEFGQPAWRELHRSGYSPHQLAAHAFGYSGGRSLLLSQRAE